MGEITIKIAGSFTNKHGSVISAAEGGHAMAINRAIMHLLAELPAAIRLDHKLHDESQHPDPDFGEWPEATGETK